MSVLIPVVALLIGLLGGWFAHVRLSLHYKELWRQAVGQLEDRSLWDGGDQMPSSPIGLSGAGLAGHQARIAKAQDQDQIPYVNGRWNLWQKQEGKDVKYLAVRMGFDPLPLGGTTNFERFRALHRRDVEQAQEAVDDMNARKQ